MRQAPDEVEGSAFGALSYMSQAAHPRQPIVFAAFMETSRRWRCSGFPKGYRWGGHGGMRGPLYLSLGLTILWRNNLAFRDVRDTYQISELV